MSVIFQPRSVTLAQPGQSPLAWPELMLAGVINYDRTQIPDLPTSGTGLTCHTLGLMVTSVQCLHCGGGTLYCTVLHCTVSLYCTVRGLDVTVAMICDWRGEARNGSGDYSPAINITTSSTEPDKD